MSLQTCPAPPPIHLGFFFQQPQYKLPLLQRRILRRMALHRLNDPALYAKHLRQHPEELERLSQDLLIAVTRFFRDPEAWEALRQDLPELMRQRTEGPLRAWVAGCGSGEEAYTLAIILLEFLGRQGGGAMAQIQVFATDASEPALQRARKGLYPESIARDLSPDRLRRFFTGVREGGAYQVLKPVRDSCIFARHDLLRDPPFPNLDIICCRNVLIYMRPQAQRRLTAMFHYALRPHGLLFLGTADGISSQGDLFALRDRKHRIYAPKPARRTGMHFTAGPGERRAASARGEDAEGQALKQADQIVLSHHAPAGVVVNERMEVVQFRGKAGQFLTPAAGKASLNLFRLAKPALAAGLHAVMDQARKSQQPARKDNVPVDLGGQDGLVRLEAMPLEGTSSVLVLFKPLRPAERAPRRKAPPANPNAAQREIARLAGEVSSAREALRLGHEAQEARNEEWMAANEEALSANEELQSINEELETSKEELQSSNEELTTVNEELRLRNYELNQLTGDLSNLMDSLDVPIVMLDMNLRIRRFTPAADAAFYLVSTDIGRPVTEIKTKIELPDLPEMIQQVLASGQVAERELRADGGQTYLLRIKPYYSPHKHIDGAVLFLLDTVLRRQAEENKAARVIAESVVEAVPGALVVLDAEWQVIRCTQSFRAMFHLDTPAIEGRPLDQLPGWSRAKTGSWRQRMLAAGASHDAVEWEGDFGAAGHKILTLEARRLHLTEPGATVTVLSIADVTAQRRAAAQAREAAERLRTAERVAFAGRMAAALAHEINNPLAAITNLVYAARQSPGLPAETRDYLARADQELLRVTHLTRDALGLFREGKTPEEIPLPAMFRDLLAVFAVRLRNRDIRVDIAGPRGAPLGDGGGGPVVEGIPTEIRRVFTNLLANAVDATPPGGVIRARVRPCAASGGRPEGIVVLISDPGPGVAPENRQRIFEPFFTTKEQTGTGLGLALAKDVVDKYHGWIKLRSRTDAEAETRGRGDGGTKGREGERAKGRRDEGARGRGDARIGERGTAPLPTGTVVAVYLPRQAAFAPPARAKGKSEEQSAGPRP